MKLSKKNLKKMSKLKTNIKFVRELLSSEGISDFERLHILQLFESEMKNFEKGVVELSEKMLDIDSKKSKFKVKKTDQYNDALIHEPLNLLTLLKLFTTNDLFKYTTHSWDRKNDGTEAVDRETFIKNLTDSFKSENFNFLNDCNSNDLYWTIYNFLFNNYEKENILENVGWAKNYNNRLKYGFKYGWGCQKVIDSLKDSDINFFDLEVDKKYRPVKYTSDFFEANKKYKKNNNESLIPTNEDVEEVLSIDELSFRYFEDFITIFKKQIEFRDSDLYHFVSSEFSKQNRVDSTLTVEGLDGLNIYTDTNRVKLAISKIAKNMSTRSKGKAITINGSISEDNSFVQIDIQHIDSFSKAHILSNSKLNLSKKEGDIWQIRDYLLSLCDFSLISIFKDDDGSEKPIEIKYLDAKRNKISKDEIQYEKINLDEIPVGFTYRLKFYL